MVTFVELATLVAFVSFLLFRQTNRLRERARQVGPRPPAPLSYRSDLSGVVPPTSGRPPGSKLPPELLALLGLGAVLWIILLLGLLALVLGPGRLPCIPSVTCSAG